MSTETRLRDVWMDIISSQKAKTIGTTRETVEKP